MDTLTIRTTITVESLDRGLATIRTLLLDAIATNGLWSMPVLGLVTWARGGLSVRLVVFALVALAFQNAQELRHLRWLWRARSYYEPGLPDAGEFRVSVDGTLVVNSDGADGGPVDAQPVALFRGPDTWVLLAPPHWFLPVPAADLDDAGRAVLLAATQAARGVVYGR